jgi:anti-sigma factor RsiW
MNCPEISPLVPRFFDGELEGRQMRAVALHVTRCAECEQELRQLEGLQAILGAAIAERIDAIDMSRIWARVATRIEEKPQSWWERLTSRGFGFEMPAFASAWPAFAGAAAVAVLTFGVWNYQTGDVTSQPQAARPGTAAFQTAELGESDVAEEIIDSPDDVDPDSLVNSAVFDSIVGSVRELTVDPETGTAVVWVSDSGDMP